MKAATGELQLTIITVLALAAVIGFFWTMWDGTIKGQIRNQWNNTNITGSKD